MKKTAITVSFSLSVPALALGGVLAACLGPHGLGGLTAPKRGHFKL